jgi:hypothetical protein
MSSLSDFWSRWPTGWNYPSTIREMAEGSDKTLIAQIFLQEELAERPKDVESAFEVLERDENIGWAAIESFMALPAVLELSSGRLKALQKRFERLRRIVTFRLEKRLRLLRARASDVSTDVVSFLAGLDFARLPELEQALKIADEEVSAAETVECGRLVGELKTIGASELILACITRASISQDVQLLRLLKTHILRSPGEHPGASMLEQLIVLEPPNLWPYRTQPVIASISALLGTTPHRLRGTNIRRWIPQPDDLAALELLKQFRDVTNASQLEAIDCLELLQTVFNTFRECDEHPAIEMLAEASGMLLVSVRGWLPGRFLSRDGTLYVLLSSRDIRIDDDYISWINSCRLPDGPLVIFDMWHHGIVGPPKVPRLTSDDIFTYIHRRTDRGTLLVRRILHLMDPEAIFRPGGCITFLLQALSTDSKVGGDEFQQSEAAMVRLVGMAALSLCGWMPSEIGKTDSLFFFSGVSVRVLQFALEHVFMNATRADITLRDLFRRERISRLGEDGEFNSGLLSLACDGIDLTSSKTIVITRAIIDWVYATDGQPFECEDILSIIPDEGIGTITMSDVQHLTNRMRQNGLIFLTSSGQMIADRAWVFYLIKESLSENA